VQVLAVQRLVMLKKNGEQTTTNVCKHILMLALFNPELWRDTAGLMSDRFRMD